MGLDLTVLSGHSLDYNVKINELKILDRLRNINLENQYFINFLSPKEDSKKEKWKVYGNENISLKEAVEQNEMGALVFDCPLGLSLYVGKYGYEVGIDIRWHHFILNKKLQKGVEELMLSLNSCFEGTKYMLYIPDNATHTSTYNEYLFCPDDFNIEEVLNKMVKEVGIPFFSLEELEKKYINSGYDLEEMYYCQKF
jgi:hypothetical protein